MTIIQSIVKARHLANEAQVRTLAAVAITGETAGEIYLRVLLAHVQAALKRTRKAKQEALLDKVHKRFYPCVVEAHGNGKLDKDTLNKRTGFARSMASTIRYFIRNGGDVRNVDVATATKTGLRSAVTPKVELTGTRTEKAIQRSQLALVKAVERLARGDPQHVREHIENVLAGLETQLEQIADHTDKATAAAKAVVQSVAAANGPAPQQPQAPIPQPPATQQPEADGEASVSHGAFRGKRSRVSGGTVTHAPHAPA